MTKRVRLDLPLVLPGIPDEADRCVARLVADLKARDGVREAHVVAASGDEPAKLCLHYDPEVISLPRIMNVAHASGASLTSRFGHLLWQMDGIAHQRRARTVAEHLCRLPGVVEAEAAASGALRIEYDRDRIDETQIRKALADIGVTSAPR